MAELKNALPTDSEPVRPNAPASNAVWWVIGYTAVVLAVDTLATFAAYRAHGMRGAGFQVPEAFLYLRWHFRNGFDLFKFVFWFAMPLAWSARSLDWGYFGVSRWRRVDCLLFPAFMAIAVASLAAIPYVPSLRDTYRGMGYSVADAWRQVLWTISWLTGWEFLHRYVLLRAVSARWPRFGWHWVPASEWIYHLQKPPLETLGMLVFSVVACRWTMSRRNILLPFGVHLAIELGLIAYLLLASRT